MEKLGEYGGDLEALHRRVEALEKRMKTTPHGQVLLELIHSWLADVQNARITKEWCAQ